MKRSLFSALIILIMCGMVQGQINSNKVLYEELTPKEFRELKLLSITDMDPLQVKSVTSQWSGKRNTI